MRKLFICLILIVLVISCDSTQPLTKILILGNSHIYTNDLPDLFKQIALNQKQDIEISSYAMSNWRLLDHVNSDNSKSLIKSGNWDYVVVQGHTFAIIDEERLGKEYYKGISQLKSLIEEAGARMVVFQNWGFKNGLPYDGLQTYELMQKKINTSIEYIAAEQNLIVAPIGSAWEVVSQNNPDVELWMYDKIHADLPGTILAAFILYKTIFPEQNITKIEFENLDAGVVNELIRSVDELFLKEP